MKETLTLGAEKKGVFLVKLRKWALDLTLGMGISVVALIVVKLI